MKQKVIELILNRPNIRTVEIADILDLEPDSVRPWVAAEIGSGTIVEEPVIAPNGKTVLSFRFFSSAPAAAAVAATLAPEPTPARVARTVPPTSKRPGAAPKPAPEVVKPAIPVTIDVPVTRKLDVPIFTATHALPPAAATRGKSKAATAIEYLLGSGPVRTASLKRAMGLAASAHPSNYLKHALQTGRVLYDAPGGMWSAVGPELVKAADAAPQPAHRCEAQSVDVVASVSEVTPAPAPAQEAQEVAAAVVAVPAKRDSGADRFIAGVLSDGSLHLRIPGESPLDLPVEHARALWEFMQTHGSVAWA